MIKMMANSSFEKSALPYHVCNGCNQKSKFNVPGFESVIVPSEIQWTSFFFFKMSLMISFRTEILNMHISPPNIQLHV